MITIPDPPEALTKLAKGAKPCCALPPPPPPVFAVPATAAFVVGEGP
jgi:hypothetical protein